MAYTGDKPWHGLGVYLPEGTGIDEMATLAGFDWEVKKSPVMYSIDGGPMLNVPNRWVLHRSDNGKALSVMSSSFQITQPKVIVEFFRDVAATGNFKLETMGMLKEGQVCWALARMDDSFDFGGGDVQLPYLMMATSCDGTLANYAGFTAVRVVCWNTLSAATHYNAEGQSTGMIRVPHSTVFNMDKVKQDLGLMATTWDKYKKDAKTMTKRNISREEAVKYFLDVLYPKANFDAADGVALLDSKPKLAKVIGIWENGVGQSTKTAQGTAYGLVNAITRFSDHESIGSNVSNDSRLRSAWFGQGNATKQRAWDNALELIAA
jgi:phage/plasmid-like protein (TIGR03299 family)